MFCKTSEHFLAYCLIILPNECVMNRKDDKTEKVCYASDRPQNLDQNITYGSNATCFCPQRRPLNST